MLSVTVVATDANSATVALAGELDLASGDRFLDKVSRLLDRGYVHIRVNAGGLRFCDSSGVGVLLRARARAMNLAGGLTIDEASPCLESVLRVSGLERLMKRSGKELVEVSRSPL